MQYSPEKVAYSVALIPKQPIILTKIYKINLYTAHEIGRMQYGMKSMLF